MKITVITVCRNSEKTIEKAIKSVIGQAGAAIELEYIVVDGKSTDGTIAILERYSSYIDKWLSEPDDGIFDAMNKGIGMAEGDVIAFLNSDDWYEENALKVVAEAFEKNDCDCICCDNYVLEKDGQQVYFDASGYSVEDLYVQMIYYHSAIFCRKEFFNKKGNFNCNYKMAADYDWFLRMVKMGARVHYIHKPVFTFCYGGISSVNAIECAREARQIALWHLPSDKMGYKEKIDRRLCEVVLYATNEKVIYPRLIEVLGKNQINILWGAGRRGIQWAKWFQKVGIEIEGIVDKNSSLWNSSIGGVSVYPPAVMENKVCNLIITPEKYVEEITSEIDRMGNRNICIFEINTLCKILAESIVDDLLM